MNFLHVNFFDSKQQYIQKPLAKFFYYVKK